MKADPCNLTKRRRAVLNAFISIEKKQDRSASLSEVARACGISDSTAHEHANYLCVSGLLTRTQFGGTNERPYYKYVAAERCPVCGKAL